MVIIICKKFLLRIIYSLLQNHKLSRSRGRRQAEKLAREKLPKTKTTHARDPVTIVGAIEKHQTSQHWNMA
jgi:hypothetical protein